MIFLHHVVFGQHVYRATHCNVLHQLTAEWNAGDRSVCCRSLNADDTQVYIALSQSDAHKSISSLSDCLTDISLWIKSSKLKLHYDKTEFIIIDTKQQRHKLSSHFPVKLLDNDICPSDSVRNLGVVFDSDFSFHKHVSNNMQVMLLAHT